MTKLELRHKDTVRSGIMNSPHVHHIDTAVSGRYLVQVPAGEGPFPLLVGFHGYGGDAEAVLTMLQAIPGSENWLCCAIQALHAFYVRNEKVGASWMTSQDRELRIQENVRYVNAVVSQVKQTYSLNDTLVYFGFSQGTGMACRAAILGAYEPDGVMLLGGDIPLELDDLDRMKRILTGRGTKDRFYPQDAWMQDRIRIEQAQLEATFCAFDGGHELHQDYADAAGKFLMTCNLA